MAFPAGEKKNRAYDSHKGPFSIFVLLTTTWVLSEDYSFPYLQHSGHCWAFSLGLVYVIL